MSWEGRVARADRKTVTQNAPEQTTAVSHRKPLSAGIFRESCSTQGHDERDTCVTGLTSHELHW
jgi:hypothetical protein